MTKRSRWTSRRRIEIDAAKTTIPTDVMSEDSHGNHSHLHSRLNRDETEKLTKLRRQGRQAGSDSPPATPPPTPPATPPTAPAPPKRRGWRRFFGS